MGVLQLVEPHLVFDALSDRIKKSNCSAEIELAWLGALATILATADSGYAGAC